MRPEQQAKVLDMLQTRGAVRSRDFVRECQGWDHRKIITRLRRAGHPIENVNPPGVEACYVYRDGTQGELFNQKERGE